MEAIRAAGVDELLAICGGVCACGTCHVYVDPQFAEIITPMGPDESELLSALTHRRPNSRLACQIRLEAPLVELKVQVAPED
jgi:2Fe-2S ferredoxin